MPGHEEPQINNVWGQAVPAHQIHTMTLPSGQVVRAKRIGVETLVFAGLIGEGDQLVSAIQKNHFGGNADKISQSILGDPKQFGTLMELLDRAAPLIVVEPTVRLHMEDIENPGKDGPKTRMIPPEEREPDAIYTDQIGLQDKVALLNFGIGGLSDLTRFREQTGPSVAAVADVPGVPVPAQPPAGNRAQRRRAEQRSRRIRD